MIATWLTVIEWNDTSECGKVFSYNVKCYYYSNLIKFGNKRVVCFRSWKIHTEFDWNLFSSDRRCFNILSRENSKIVHQAWLAGTCRLLLESVMWVYPHFLADFHCEAESNVQFQTSGRPRMLMLVCTYFMRIYVIKNLFSSNESFFLILNWNWLHLNSGRGWPTSTSRAHFIGNVAYIYHIWYFRSSNSSNKPIILSRPKYYISSESVPNCRFTNCHIPLIQSWYFIN